MSKLCESHYAKELKKQNINIGDCVSVVYYVDNYGECEGKGIIELTFNKFNSPELKIRIVETSYDFYLNWTFKISRFIKIEKIEKIEMDIEDKITLVQLAKYQSCVNHIKSRWFNKEREVISALWEKHSKIKDRASKVIDDYINTKKERGLNSDYKFNMFHCMVWIIEFTNQKKHTKKSLLDFEIMQ